MKPGACGTELVLNEPTFKLFCPGNPDAGLEDAYDGFKAINLLPVPYVDPIDISNGVLYLASDKGRYVTAIELPIDAGYTVKSY